jgi:SpoIID/LytB domain protein
MTIRLRTDGFLIFTLFFLLISLSRVFGDDAPVVRVGLVAGIGSVNTIAIASKSQFQVFDASLNDSVADVDGKTLVLAIKDKQIDISIDGSLQGSFTGPIRLIQSDAGAVFDIEKGKKKVHYRGTLEIRGGKKLFLIDELPLEDYVRGVIPVEVPRMFQFEAQKALTVAIRTYAIKSMGRHLTDGYNMCDTVHCQGFSGANRDADWIDKLIDSTRGQIATYNGDPIYALYSTDCGGVTESNEDSGIGKSPIPYLQSVTDCPDTGSEDYCADSPHHAWQKTYTIDELDSHLSKTSKVGKLASIEFAEYDKSGRVKTVLIKGEKGEYRMPGNKFRDLMGADIIKNTLMTLVVTDDGQYRISGKGYGHGLGLCAFGANGMAKAGFKYADILKHYYTGIEIKDISEIKLTPYRSIK